MALGEARLGGKMFMGDPEGFMVSCSAGQFVSETVATLTYSANVCDDSGDTPCAGRLTTLGEFCGGPGSGSQPFEIGAYSGILGSAAVRVCYDESGTGDCRGDDAFIVATYTTKSVGYTLGNGERNIHKSRGEFIIQSSIPFELSPGQMVQLNTATLFNELEIAFDLSFSCFTDPIVKCGLVSYAMFVETARTANQPLRAGPPMIRPF